MTAGKGSCWLPRRLRSKRSGRVVARGWHWWLVHHSSVLGRICLEHDASLRGSFAQGTLPGLARVREMLRVLWTAHEQQCINGIFLGLLARHAEDACSRCRRYTLPRAHITMMLSLRRS